MLAASIGTAGSTEGMLLSGECFKFEFPATTARKVPSEQQGPRVGSELNMDFAITGCLGPSLARVLRAPLQDWECLCYIAEHI